MSENAEQKAKRYLAEGRLTVYTVTPDMIDAECRGGGARYYVTWRPGGEGWSCNCPARSVCAHLRALQLVTVRGERAGE